MNDSLIITTFEKTTGYGFKNADLLVRALTHSSQTSSTGQHNERLEFLGDRVLALVIAEYIYEKFPESPEGEMALRLNSMVRKETCAQVARDMQLGELMKSLADKSVVHKGIFESQNVLGDACEAVLAAVYLDGGLDKARNLILTAWKDLLSKDNIIRKDPKSTLQEWALARGLEMPVYTEISRQGPDHAPEFVMSVKITGQKEICGQKKMTGKGASKRAAEQSAAENFLTSNKIEF